jgi:hypothetical protein
MARCWQPGKILATWQNLRIEIASNLPTFFVFADYLFAHPKLKTMLWST